MKFLAFNQFNRRTYPANGEHWPEHGWHFQIYDLSPDTWGRAPSGIGAGPVIDQGFQNQLEKRGWRLTTSAVNPSKPEDALNQIGPLPEPVNQRDTLMKKLAASFVKKPKTENRAQRLVNSLLENDPVVHRVAQYLTTVQDELHRVTREEVCQKLGISMRECHLAFTQLNLMGVLRRSRSMDSGFHRASGEWSPKTYVINPSALPPLIPENDLEEDCVPGGSSEGERHDTRGLDPLELAIGQKVEREHTKGAPLAKRKAEEIAIDHLVEPGHKKYYTRLAKAGLTRS